MELSHLSKALLATLVSGACAVHTPAEKPAPPIELPAAYAGAAAGPRNPASMADTWWRDFGDPELDALVARALAGNFSLRAAWARLAQAQAQLRGAGAARLPRLDLSVSAGRGDLGSPAGAGSASGGSGSPSVASPGLGTGATNQLSASLTASYELDLWRRLAANQKAATLSALATRDDMEAIAMSLAGETAEAWLDILATREHRAILEAQLSVTKKLLDLLTLRFDEGLGVAAVDVYQARGRHAAVAAQAALIDASEAVATHRLAALLGRAPGTVGIAPRALLPDLPALPNTGVPADLVLRRPDVRAMQRRVEAADWRVAQAVAERLPRISLSGTASVFGSSPANLWAQPLWNLAGNLLAPIFDGGRRKAEADRARSAHDELIASYGETVIQAMVEVENALALERGQRDHIAKLGDQLTASRSALHEAQARYAEGLTDFLPVLEALERLQTTEGSLIDARRQLLSYRVALYRALGGTWTRNLDSRVAASRTDGDHNE